MGAAQQYSEFVARLAAERPRLHVARMMGVRWLTFTEERLLRQHRQHRLRPCSRHSDDRTHMQGELGKKLFCRKRAHANTRWFNDREVSGQIGPFNNPGGKSGADSAMGGIGNRSNTMPEDAGRPARQASSPKSLSKVSTIRASRAAHASTSSSFIPGAAVRTQTMSCPAAFN